MCSILLVRVNVLLKVMSDSLGSAYCNMLMYVSIVDMVSERLNSVGAISQSIAMARMVREPLGQWWDANARDLPWRFGRTDAWGILVSEVMSQQTQMGRVVPYWTAWMRCWPSPVQLASASTADVVTAWGRLGYPKRALRLQACARVVVDDYDNQLPKTYKELTSLPGVGDYTACAVMSFAFGEPVAVIDTNIRRVLSRVFLAKESIGGSASREERQLADIVLASQAEPGQVASSMHSTAHSSSGSSVDSSAHLVSMTPSIWNQAVMELGALVCKASRPDCESCPIRQYCSFWANGRPGLGQKRTRPRQHFQGTNRQVRGIILQALRQADSKRLARTAIDELWDDAAQLGECVISLEQDGLIALYDDGSLSLP